MTQTNHALKYGISLGLGFSLWVVPISLKAPRMVTFGSLLMSMGCFTSCWFLATPLGQSGLLARMQRQQDRELLDYQYALQEASIKEQLREQFFPSNVPVSVPVAALPAQPAIPRHLANKLEKLKDLEPHLLLILECAIEKEGTITARDAMRFKGLAGKHTADEIKAFFQELQQANLGTVSNDSKRKDTLVFTIDTDVYNWVKS